MTEKTSNLVIVFSLVSTIICMYWELSSHTPLSNHGCVTTIRPIDSNHVIKLPAIRNQNEAAGLFFYFVQLFLCQGPFFIASEMFQPAPY